MKHDILLYFGLPAGAVYSNLIASVICVGVAWWRLRARTIAHHAAALAQAEEHHLERIALAVEHHQALKAHITASVPARAARQAKTLVTKTGKGGRSMTGYCARCGWHRLLDAVTYWCGTCLDTWTREYQARGKEPA